eukprot:764958-Hanusia_phi.AAC.6
MAQRAEEAIRRLKAQGVRRAPVNRSQEDRSLGGWNVEDEDQFMAGMENVSEDIPAAAPPSPSCLSFPSISVFLSCLWLY